MRVKAPSFQFYAADFLTGTMGMSLEAKGAYIHLLCWSWTIGGGLTRDHRQLAAGLGVNLARFKQIWNELRSKFVVRNNRFCNARLEQIRSQQVDFHKKQAEKGKKGAAARWAVVYGRGHAPAIAQAQPEHDPSIFNKREDLGTSEDPDVLEDLASTRSSSARENETAMRWTPESTPAPSPTALARPQIAPVTPSLPRPGHEKCYASEGCWHGLCIPRTLGAEWTAQWRDPAQASIVIASIVRDTVAKKPDGGVTGGYEFWRAVWKFYHPGGITAQANTRESRILAAARRTQAAIDRGEL